MANYPERITVTFQYNVETGLIAATSDDLRALLVVGKTIEDVGRQIAPSIVAIIKAKYGVDVEAEREHEIGDVSGFVPMPHECEWALSAARAAVHQ